MTLGEIIKNYRKFHDLSLQQFADIAGLSKGYVSMVEKGVNGHTGKPLSPSVETVEKCAKAMGTTAKSLFAIVDGKSDGTHFDETDGRRGAFFFYFFDDQQQEEELLSSFRQLDDEGKKAVLDLVKALVPIAKRGTK